MILSRRHVLAIPITAMLMAQAFAPQALAAKAASNAELRIGTNQEFENLNPLIATMSATRFIQDFVSRGRAMITLGVDGKWHPTIVTKIPSIEDGGVVLFDEGGKKKMRVTWEILKDAKWGDGTPVTAKDVEFEVSLGRAETISIPNREPYEAIEKFEIDPANPKKFTLTYNRARYDYALIAPGASPRHLEEAVFKKHGKAPQGYDNNSKFTTDAANPGLYLGPYRVSEIKLGSHVKLVVNDKWWGAKPKVKNILIKLIPSTATLEANLLSGDVHMTNQQGMSFDQAVEFEKKVKAEKLPFKVLFEPGLTYEHIDLNLDHPILKDLKVRKALNHAIDRKALTDALFAGKQPPAVHNLSPIDPGYTADPKKITIYEHSTRKAERLLEEAGWKKGPDGIRVKDGQRLTLRLGTTAGNKARENVQVFIQNQLKRVGVEITVKNEPARVFFAETTLKRQFDMAMYAWVSNPDQSVRSTMHSSMIPSKQNSWSGQNQPGWRNAENDRLIDAFENEFDAAKRKDIMAQLLKLYTDDIPVLPLFYRANVIVAPSNIENFAVPPGQDSEAFSAELWNLKDVKG